MEGNRSDTIHCCCWGFPPFEGGGGGLSNPSPMALKAQATQKNSIIVPGLCCSPAVYCLQIVPVGCYVVGVETYSSSGPELVR